MSRRDDGDVLVQIRMAWWWRPFLISLRLLGPIIGTFRLSDRHWFYSRVAYLADHAGSIRVGKGDWQRLRLLA